MITMNNKPNIPILRKSIVLFLGLTLAVAFSYSQHAAPKRDLTKEDSSEAPAKPKRPGTDAIKEDTRTVIGSRGTNNVQFTAASTPKALEYICDEFVNRAIT